MPTRFFTNEGENTLLKKFAGVFACNPDIERFDALVGYLRASGYFALRPHLEKVPLIRILVGIDVDAQLAQQHRKGLLLLGDADKTLAAACKQIEADVQGAPYRKDVEDGIRQFIADVAAKRVQIKAHSTKRLHAKLYVFIPRGFCEHKPGAVITGSSNLTAAGIGAENAAGNYEFNVLLHDYDDVRFAADEFEKLWGQAVNVLPEAIGGVVRESYLRDDLTPFELYIKLLIEYIGPAIEYDPNAESDLPKGVKALSYQGDAVNDGWLKLQKHGGFFLADVVGLGKTIVATRIAKSSTTTTASPRTAPASWSSPRRRCAKTGKRKWSVSASMMPSASSTTAASTKSANPYSHAHSTPAYKSEIQRSILAVKALESALAAIK